MLQATNNAGYTDSFPTLVALASLPSMPSIDPYSDPTVTN
jgi:hypothetical protein